MSYPQGMGSIPAKTVRRAQAACPKGTLAMRLRDELGTWYTEEQFAALSPVEGHPASAPWRLALVTVLQYSENLTDRQAANAVRERIDWKYRPLRFCLSQTWMAEITSASFQQASYGYFSGPGIQAARTGPALLQNSVRISREAPST